MNPKVLTTLEYDKIIAMLAQRAASEPGRRKCLELTPVSDHNDGSLTVSIAYDF